MRIAMLLHKSVEFDSRVRREAAALAAAGHAVVVLELARVPGGTATLDGFTRRSALPPAWVHRVLPFHLYRVAFLLWFIAGVVRLRPEVIHAHDAAMLLPGAIGARLTGARLVYDSHELATSVPYRERTWAWFVGAVERLVVPRAAAVITVSEGIAERLQARYRLPERPVVVRNVSALEPSSGAGVLRSALGIGDDTPLVLHQGAPAPDRGCEVLVDAVALLRGVHLAFLGDPEPGYAGVLAGRIAARGVGSRIRMLPSVPLDTLLASTAQADVGVTLLQDTCENHRLALPNKLFEYIAARVPVVAGDLPETARLLERHEVGWTTDPADPRAVALVIAEALRHRDDPALRERLERAARELCWPLEQGRLLGLYSRLADADRRDWTAEPRRPSAKQRALVLVRNTVSHDARVLREAATLRELGCEVLIAGVVSTRERETQVQLDGIPVLRLDPAGAAWRRVPRALRRARPGQAEGDSEPAGRSSDPAATRRPSAAAVVPARASVATARTTSRRHRLPSRLRRVVLTGAYYLEGIRLARRFRPDLVHANDYNTMWIALGARLLCRSRVVYDTHELWADRNGRPEWRPWLIACESLFVRLADTIITASPGYATELARRYRISAPNVIRNIPVAPATDNGAWIGAPSERETGSQTAVYIGGLMPGRGLEAGIRALSAIPELRLELIGPGHAAYRARLEQTARDAGVNDRVRILAPVAPGEVAAVLRGAAMGLMLIEPICRSYELTLPNKLFEYAAAGVPILASNLPVIGSVVSSEGLGEVVPVGDPEGIAAGMRRLATPERQTLVREQIAAFASRNTWMGERTRLAAVYRRLVE